MNQLFNRLYTSVSLHNNTIVTRPINDWIIEIDYILYRLINRDPFPSSPFQKWKTWYSSRMDEYTHCRSKSHSYIIDIIYFRWHKSRRRVFKKRVSRNYHYLVCKLWNVHARNVSQRVVKQIFFFDIKVWKRKKKKTFPLLTISFHHIRWQTSVSIWLTSDR